MCYNWPMPVPILSTKLYVPPPGPNLVRRARLIERLNAGLQHRLTLISAPAGFGKTTLLSSWIDNLRTGGATEIDDLRADITQEYQIANRKSKIQNRQSTIVNRVAWLSLDEGDNDPVRFLAYLMAALQPIVPVPNHSVSDLFQSPPPIESTLTELLNEIATAPDDLLLVLDDYHVINSKAVDDALTFLLDHLPPQMHLAIATREDPPFPLARLRVRGQMTEFRAVDLRFTANEAAEFLNELMGLNLSANEIAALELHTEGWIAGMQMAALSMQGRDDRATFIQAFSGSHRYVLDYLVEEVLQRQSEYVQSFLLQTSILARLCGALCDAVTQQMDGRVMLETLERDNLFVVPLDDQRHWYRYHHLFAEVLQTRALAQQSDQIRILHQRASEWYAQNGFLSDAIRHAFAAGDFERAANLVELARPAMDRNFQSATWLGWVRALPDELVRNRPVLSVGFAFSLLGSGELEAGEARLRDAEQWLAMAAEIDERPEVSSRDVSEVGMVVIDEVQFRSLPATIATARAHYAQSLGDIPSSIAYAQRALDLLAEDDHIGRAPPAAILGLAYWTRGDLEAAYRAFADGMARMELGSNIPSAIGGTSILADIRVAQGRLHEAVRTYEQSLQLAQSYAKDAGELIDEKGEPVFPGMTELYVGLSELHCERGNLESAAQCLMKSEALGKQAMIPGNEYRLYAALARIKEAQGDLDGALNLLDEAERLTYRTAVPNVRPVSALKTRVWLRQGRQAEALGWVRERGLSVDDEPSYLHEFEHITLIRVLIAQYRRNLYKRTVVEDPIYGAKSLLARLLQAAEKGGRVGSVIEILLLQALVYEAQGVIPSALVSLERALMLAEPEGYVRLFVAEGPSMAALLRAAAKAGISLSYVRQLQSSFPKTEASSPVSQPLIEPLTIRELELLNLVAAGLSNQQIADKLVISIATTKKHLSNILGKLSASNRTEAVRRAQDLQLL